MRKLALKDAFTLSRIIKSADIKSELIQFVNDVNSNKKNGKALDVEEIGMKLLLTLLEAVSDTKVEREFYKLYGDIKGISESEASEIDFETFSKDIRQIVKDNDLTSFFRSASILT